jgi:hypothetical protein
MTVDYTQIPGHRRRIATTSRRAGATVLIVATLAIGAAITSHTPNDDTQQRPFVRTGNVGSVVNARTFDVKVLGVRGAAVISADDGPHDTSGIWIIVRVRLTAIGNPLSLGYAALLDGQGRTYRATGRIDQSLLDGRELEPGIPVTAEIAFEVPTSVASDLSLQLASAPDDLRMDAMAQIRVPIDAAQIRQWQGSKTPTTVAAPAVGT